MKNRREFLKIAGLGSAFLLTNPLATLASPSEESNEKKEKGKKPLLLSTWSHGMPANEMGWKCLLDGKSILDAVQQGVMVVESDPQYNSVGFGGLPDREGHVTLDACLMDHEGRCGSVAFLETIKNPIAVARKVMDETPHVMMVGSGALQFALSQGFKSENLLTAESKKAWEDWLKTSHYQPVINIENHDTIGMVGIDAEGKMAGACTTSGLAYKMHGRVGDSPIIGAGLYVDGEVGAACATGLGETVIRIVGSHTVVELMRHGRTPQKACEEAIERLVKRHPNAQDLQVGFLAMNAEGVVGAYSVNPGFNYAVTYDGHHELAYALSHFPPR